jgi:hypothetical protein
VGVRRGLGTRWSWWAVGGWWWSGLDGQKDCVESFWRGEDEWGWGIEGVRGIVMKTVVGACGKTTSAAGTVTGCRSRTEPVWMELILWRGYMRVHFKV